jgi:hypothetical protein
MLFTFVLVLSSLVYPRDALFRWKVEDFVDKWGKDVVAVVIRSEGSNP